MNTQRQMLLDLKSEQVPTLENFVAGANAELVARLHTMANANCFELLYLWGSASCGKSHLLAATAAAAEAQRPVLYLNAEKVGAGVTAASGSLLVIDDVQRLDADAQIALFRMFNSARFLGLALLLSGDAPPLQLALREDLRTRVGQMLIYEIKTLSDEEKAAALEQHAILRGMLLDAGVVQYLLRHGRRDLPSLIGMLNSLDCASLEQHRPPTVPLLRELMQTNLNIDAP
ncbi:MAG: DnaA regulatory inactivator Hda [Rugosibacter sp.]